MSAKSIILALAVVASLAGAFALGRKTAKLEPLERIDTLYRVDTFRAEIPAPFAVYVKDTIRVALTDTLRFRDTLFVELPTETREYRDTSYYARVSGFRPSLDYIEVYSRTVTIERTAPVPRLSFGVQLGAGLQYGLVRQGFDVGPYVGAGIQYKF